MPPKAVVVNDWAWVTKDEIRRWVHNQHPRMTNEEIEMRVDIACQAATETREQIDDQGRHRRKREWKLRHGTRTVHID